jgi:hypothetical protein
MAIQAVSGGRLGCGSARRESLELIQLALLAGAFVVVDAIVFAIVSLTSQELMAYPIAVTAWVAFVWVFGGRALRAFSAPPYPPRRAIAIVVIASGVATAALVLAIAIGVLSIAR